MRRASLTLSDRIAVKALIPRGGVIAYPTESVIGLGCDPFNAVAVNRLLCLKRRSWQKGLILVAACEAQFEPILAELSIDVRLKLSQSWPGATTWLVPSRQAVPTWITGRYSTVALRVSSHPTVQALCHCIGGPLVSTSANVSGRPATKSSLIVRKQFKHELDWFVAGDTGPRRQPSTIKNALTGEVVRPG